jgi:mRNA interferase RelE/StbE
VSLRVIYEEKAIDQAAGFLADDPAGLGTVPDAVDRLAGDPRPAESFPYGSPDLRRLRIGRYRVLDEINGDVVSIGHIARGENQRLISRRPVRAMRPSRPRSASASRPRLAPGRTSTRGLATGRSLSTEPRTRSDRR